MKRTSHIWIIFGLCLVVAFAAMAWISLTTVKLERDSRRHASLEENVRLALWRMESALAPLIAQETARPYFLYDAFYVEERAYTRMFSRIGRGEVVVPSPLLTDESPYILLHFQFRPDGDLTSPQVPTGNMRDVAETSYTSQDRIRTASARLDKLRSFLARDTLLRDLPAETPRAVMPVRLPATEMANRRQTGFDEQTTRNTIEWQARASSQGQLQANFNNELLPRPSGVTAGMMKAIWVEQALVLARRVSVNGDEYVQGCWLDWLATRRWLLSGINDLLPSADLQPAGWGRTAERGRMLASLPVRLMPGELPAGFAAPTSPLLIWLLIAGGCLLLAAVAVAVLLHGAISLSERRGAFVSAVTHELRTPLTTLRMYAEMLAEGIVSGKEKTRLYFQTLLEESDRLGHLIDNVLAFARLDGHRGRRLESIALHDLIDKVKNRLAHRAEQAGMHLIVESADAVDSISVLADPSAVEQILFNLVDNACKYGASGSDGQIQIQARDDGRFVSFRVRDHGPGIAQRDIRRLFHPFCKSARDAANSMPGVGLGLALSRRLARSMGGDLRLDQSVTSGASFVLTLPVHKSPP
jgi:signal transduction histidine kinase